MAGCLEQELPGPGLAEREVQGTGDAGEGWREGGEGECGGEEEREPWVGQDLPATELKRVLLCRGTRGTF